MKGKNEKSSRRERCILLADMNSFFASVHQAIDPRLRGKPVVVAGDPAKRHGIVLAASYEAKKYGIKTGMVLGEARRLLPDAVYLPPSYDLYVDFSLRILKIMKDFTPLVEPFSIDEAFLDVTGCEHLWGDGVTIARRLKERIREEVGVLCSVGVAPNKLLAKMAAELEKPDGLTVLTREDVPVRLWPLPVRELFGVGPRIEAKLLAMNIRTIGDLARCPVKLLEKKFGVVGRVLYLSAHGIDPSPVDPGSLEEMKSVGNRITLPRDYHTLEEMKAVLLLLAEEVARRARRKGYGGRTVTLTLRSPDFVTHSWSRTLPWPTDLAEDIYAAAVALFQDHWPSWRGVRMVGITLGNLQPLTCWQRELWSNRERLRQLARTCDRLREKYGPAAVRRARVMSEGGILSDE